MKKSLVAMAVLTALVTLGIVFGCNRTGCKGSSRPSSAGTDMLAVAGAMPAEAMTPLPSKPEQTLTLSNDVLEVVVSSKGAALNGAVLTTFRERATPESGPVRLDFSDRRALAPVQLAGIPAAADFDLTPAADGHGAELAYRTPDGLIFRRTITLPAGRGYLLDVVDVLVYPSNPPPVLPAYALQLAAMRNVPGEIPRGGVPGYFTYGLGVDVRPAGGRVKHLRSRLDRYFKDKKNRIGAVLPETVESQCGDVGKVEWLAVKNRYFAQILIPDETTDGPRLWAVRELTSGETPENLCSKKMTSLKAVGVAAMFPAAGLEAGKPIVRTMHLYIGPKLYTELAPLKRRVTDIVELGCFSGIGRGLVVALNFLRDWFWPHNYGLAIIWLMILVRVVIWALSRKFAKNAKRMRQIEPLLAEVRATHKDNPRQRLQQETALYRKHRISPMSGCLPLLFTAPLGLAVGVTLLFAVSNAAELRFASFLWVKSLGEPENLFPFGFTVPLLGASGLNILPILVFATGLWQQRLSPATGDATAAERWKGIFGLCIGASFLCVFYNLPAGMALYWTTGNLLSIAMTCWGRRRPVPAPELGEADDATGRADLNEPSQGTVIAGRTDQETANTTDPADRLELLQTTVTADQTAWTTDQAALDECWHKTELWMQRAARLRNGVGDAVEESARILAGCPFLSTESHPEFAANVKARLEGLTLAGRMIRLLQLRLPGNDGCTKPELPPTGYPGWSALLSVCPDPASARQAARARLADLNMARFTVIVAARATCESHRKNLLAYVAKQILPVLDAIDDGERHLRELTTDPSFRMSDSAMMAESLDKCYAALRECLLKTLDSAGIRAMSVGRGEAVDYLRHEPYDVEPDPDVGDEHIKEVVRRGYEYASEDGQTCVLRTAQVVVVKNSVSTGSESSPPQPSDVDPDAPPEVGPAAGCPADATPRTRG